MSWFEVTRRVAWGRTCRAFGLVLAVAGSFLCLATLAALVGRASDGTGALIVLAASGIALLGSVAWALSYARRQPRPFMAAGPGTRQPALRLGSTPRPGAWEEAPGGRSVATDPADQPIPAVPGGNVSALVAHRAEPGASNGVPPNGATSELPLMHSAPGGDIEGGREPGSEDVPAGTDEDKSVAQGGDRQSTEASDDLVAATDRRLGDDSVDQTPAASPPNAARTVANNRPRPPARQPLAKTRQAAGAGSGPRRLDPRR